MWCQCGDSECPHCSGECADKATTTLFRVDMGDETGTSMCDECADDAYQSGLFWCEDDND